MDNVAKPTAKNLRGLRYHGDEGNYSVYRYYKGGRAIFEAAVDKTDPLLKIHVGKVNAVWAKVNDITGPDASFDATLFETKGHASYATDDTGTHIASHSVRAYIAPRAFSILANLFVYKPATVTDAEALDEHDGDDTDED